MRDAREIVVGACVVGVFATLERAEQAVHRLRHAGFLQNQISLVAWHPKDSLAPIEKLKVGNDPAIESAIVLAWVECWDCWAGS